MVNAVFLGMEYTLLFDVEVDGGIKVDFQNVHGLIFS